MQANFPASADIVEIEEGGYSSTRGDDGNWTLGRVEAGRLVGSMKGISAPQMVRWLGDESLVTTAVMRAIDTPTFRAIGNAYTWRALNLDAMPGGPDHLAWNFGFNSGVSRQGKQLQAIVGLTGRDVDGDIGSQTMDALHSATVERILAAIDRARGIILQRRLGFADEQLDGICGKITAAAVRDQAQQDAALCCALATAQEAAYRSFRTFNVDGAGWLARLGRALDHGLSLVGH